MRWITWPLAAGMMIGVAAAQTTTAPAKPQRPATAPSAVKPRPVVKPVPPAPPALMTDDQKIIYALGLSMANSIKTFDLTPAEVEIVKRALSDAAAGKPAEPLSEWGPKIQGLAQTRGAIVAAKEKAASDAFLAKSAAEPGATKTASGLIYRETRPGTGPSPKTSDTVKVNYRGTLTNGTEFDSSYARNEPAQFPLTGVIPCWTEGLQLMKVGGKATLVCPSNIAYGERGQREIPPGAALIFEVELLSIVGQAPQ